MSLALPSPVVQSLSPGEIMPRAPKMPRIAVKKVVEAYLGDAVNRNRAVATLDKLETIFKKQFLPWTEAQGFEYIG
jgi:hypothetical protein